MMDCKVESVIQRESHYAQKSFVMGRNGTTNIVQLDAKTKVYDLKAYERIRLNSLIMPIRSNKNKNNEIARVDAHVATTDNPDRAAPNADWNRKFSRASSGAM